MTRRRSDELDLSELNEIFGVDGEEGGSQKTVDFCEEPDYDDSIDIIRKNIKRANAILDKIQDEMNNGNFSARMAEVAGNIINSITTASQQIIGKENYTAYMEVRKELNKLKEREVIVKEAKKNKPTNQNLILTNREDLLKLLEGKKTPKQIENNAESELKKINDERNEENG